MNYHLIKKDDLLNGDGIRVTLFVSGCGHQCKGCQNPQTWDCNSGMLFDENAKKFLFKQLKKNYISGITYSGGDPLYISNRDEITELAKEIREKFPSKTQWLYTGYEYKDIRHLEILEYIDVLVDGKYIEELRSPNKPWVGSANQEVIRFKRNK